jgi:hypothetical protein
VAIAARKGSAASRIRSSASSGSPGGELMRSRSASMALSRVSEIYVGDDIGWQDDSGWEKRGIRANWAT